LKCAEYIASAEIRHIFLAIGGTLKTEVRGVVHEQKFKREETCDCCIVGRRLVLRNDVPFAFDNRLYITTTCSFIKQDVEQPFTNDYSRGKNDAISTIIFA
jgi:hypothetical protein